MNETEYQELVRQTTEIVSDECDWCGRDMPEDFYYYYRSFNEGGNTVEAGDFCSTACRAAWMAKRGLAK